jgi:hypothetical protein
MAEGGFAANVLLSFSNFKSLYAAHATTADQRTILANMTLDPSHGGNPSSNGGIYLAPAEAKALGLNPPPSSLGVDGAVGFSSAFSYNFGNGGSGYDFIGIAEHEITHALGRVSNIVAPTAGHPASGVAEVLDITRYTAPGVLATGAYGGNEYFSIDGGKTALNYYAASGDTGDWSGSLGIDPNNAFGSTTVSTFSAVDKLQVEALGYALV